MYKTNSSNPFNNKNINISFGSEEFYKLLPKIPKKNIPEFFSNSEMNFLEYKHSCDYDRRSFLQIYSSILKEENNLVFSFSYCNDDFNLSLVKLSFFIIQIILHITFTCFFFSDDCFFFSDDIINKIKDLKYEIKSLIYIIKPIVFTFVICSMINKLLKALSKINNNVLEIKYEKINYKDGLKKIRLKLIFYFIIGFIFISFGWALGIYFYFFRMGFSLFFWCFVYKNIYKITHLFWNYFNCEFYSSNYFLLYNFLC